MVVLVVEARVVVVLVLQVIALRLLGWRSVRVVVVVIELRVVVRWPHRWLHVFTFVHARIVVLVGIIVMPLVSRVTIIS